MLLLLVGEEGKNREILCFCTVGEMFRFFSGRAYVRCKTQCFCEVGNILCFCKVRNMDFCRFLSNEKYDIYASVRWETYIFVLL